MPQGRSDRVGELIRQEVAKLLVNGLKDPRVGFVSVMDVRMSKDLRYANVYVSLYGSESERKSSLIALRNSEKWTRREVGRHLRLRHIPEIRFFPDDTLDKVYHLAEVLDHITEERKSMPLIKTDPAGIVEALRAGERFLVTSHVSPDGDSLGSSLALVRLLRALGKKQVTCAMADPVPAMYAELPGAAKIVQPGGDAEAPEVDTVLVVDVSSLERLGSVADWIPAEARVVVVDHHLNDQPEGHLGWIDPTYAAAGELVVALFDEAGIEIDDATALCLYVAQTTDTGGYRFSNTTARSHRIAARLLEHNIDVSRISRQVFDLLPRPKVALLRLVLDRMDFRCDGAVAFSHITQADLEATGAGKEDINGLVNYCGNIEGVRVGLLFTGVEPGLTKASLRAAPGFNAAAFLAPFGGGGHAAAAGITLKESLEAAQSRLLNALPEALHA
jgi:phosphoesterase RecJ-like protein